MPEGGKKGTLWVTVGAPLFVAVVSGIILRARIPGWLAAIPDSVYWVLAFCVVAGVAFVAGQRVERSRRRGKRITRAEAEGLVLGSNYWSKLERRRGLHRLQAEVDYEKHGIERDLDPFSIEIENEIDALKSRGMDVDSVLQRFWDDHPAARSGDLYQHDTLLEWLEARAHEAKLPQVIL